MSIRTRLLVWRAVRRMKAQPQPSGRGRRGLAPHEPSKHDFFPWPGGKAWRNGAWVYVPPVGD